MLVLNNIHVDLGGRPVLRGVNATFEPGATVAVVGRNGAGKTTLLRTVMGVALHKSGSLQWNGRDLTRDPAHGRASLGFGYAPEDRVILPTMSVEENLRLPCQIQRQATALIDQRIQYVLEVVPQLKQMLSRSGAALSGGQAKMVALGRALMIGTRLVLLDEPFQGLAPVLAEQYGDALRALRKSQPQLCVVVTESNDALLHNVQSRTLYVERGVVSERHGHADAAL